MSAQSFALTSPSITDVTDSIALNEARSRFYDAERQGDAALADWARAYAPPLLAQADAAPDDDALEAAAQEAANEVRSANANEIQELLITAEPAFRTIADLQRQLSKIVENEAAA